MNKLLAGLGFVAFVACGGNGQDAGAQDAGASDVGVDDREFAVFVRGTLGANTTQADHDQLAQGGEAAAKAAGDFGHDALLGSGLLGTESSGFLGIDRWDNLQGLTSFYQDPAFMQGFAALFEGAPILETTVHRPDWHGWGSLASGDQSPSYFFVMARGRLASADLTAMQTMHDTVAAGGEAMVRQAGDVAHVVFLGLEDPQEFTAIDVWTSSTAIEAVYTNPDFQAGFLPLFEGMPTIEVYRSTDWHQW